MPLIFREPLSLRHLHVFFVMILPLLLLASGILGWALLRMKKYGFLPSGKLFLVFGLLFGAFFAGNYYAYYTIARDANDVFLFYRSIIQFFFVIFLGSVFFRCTALIDGLILTGALFLFANVVYSRFYSDFIPLQVIGLAGEANLVWSNVPHLLRPLDFLFLIYPLSLILTARLACRLAAFKEGGHLVKIAGKASMMMVLMTCCFLLANIIVVDKKPLKNIFESVFSPYHRFRNKTSVGVMMGLLGDGVLYRSTGISDGHKQEYFRLLAEKYVVPEDKPNILAIQVESLDFNIIGFRWHDTLVMPFLTQLKDKSVFYENFYANHHINGGSSVADFSMLTSRVASRTGAFPWSQENLPTITTFNNALQQLGYEAVFFHGYMETMWNRMHGYRAIGFKPENIRGDYYYKIGIDGLPDHKLISRILDDLREIDEPFFALYITISSHPPFSHVNEMKTPWGRTIDVQDVPDKMTRSYFKTMAYVDSVLEALTTEVFKQWPHTLLILTSDQISLLQGPIYSAGSKLKEHVPLFIVYKDLRKTIRTEACHRNIAPTVFEILGLPIPEEWEGKPVF